MSTHLGRFVEALRSEQNSVRDWDRIFPMYALPSCSFLEMVKIQTYEELREEGSICRFRESMGRAMFVSHQWLSLDNPDPNLQQLEVLQKAVKSLKSGDIQVQRSPVVELFLGRIKCPTAADFNDPPLYIWYDYFCIPQGTSDSASEDRRNAIRSIPSYLSQCFFFVILCPALQHEDGSYLSFSTWAQRGWCRLEKMARDLTREDGYLISLELALKPTLAPIWIGPWNAPGRGDFSLEADRKGLSPVLQRLIWTRLHNSLLQKDLPSYRLLLNRQRQCLDGLADPLDAFVPGFSTEIDPSVDPQAFVVARFLHENGFTSVTQRDEIGWSPLCYAVIRNDPFLVEGLLKSRANPNDKTRKEKKESQRVSFYPVLSQAVATHSNKVVQTLLLARANANASDGVGGNALIAAVAMDNTEAVGMLFQAKIDPNKRIPPGTSAFKMACAFSSVRTIKEMRQHSDGSLRYCLHFGLAFMADSNTVSYLLEASADVNERFFVPKHRRTWWMLLNMLSLRHRLSPSSLTYLAYHHRGATPLMFSIMTGKFDAASILLAAGARLDLRNCRGKTAADMLQETAAPISLTPQAPRADLPESCSESDSVDDSDGTICI